MAAEPVLPVPRRWLGPVRIPDATRRLSLDLAQRLHHRLGAWPRWLILGLVFGTLPALLDYATGWPASRFLTALLLTPVWIAAVAQDSLAKGALALGAAFVAHSALFIALAAVDPAPLAVSLPQGQEYWLESEHWLRTGVSREYELSWWLPAHIQCLGAVSLFTYLSLGLVTFWQGFYEVDLMNIYVGRLAAHSQSPWTALALGWHPWSLCRAAGYLFIAFEVTSFSFERFTGSVLSTRRRRQLRWLAGLSLLTVDGLLKFFFLDAVRGVLAANLR